MYILPSFAEPRVISKVYFFLSSKEQKKNILKMFLPQHSSEYIIIFLQNKESHTGLQQNFFFPLSLVFTGLSFDMLFESTTIIQA